MRNKKETLCAISGLNPLSMGSSSGTVTWGLTAAPGYMKQNSQSVCPQQWVTKKLRITSEGISTMDTQSRILHDFLQCSFNALLSVVPDFAIPCTEQTFLCSDGSLGWLKSVTQSVLPKHPKSFSVTGVNWSKIYYSMVNFRFWQGRNSAVQIWWKVAQNKRNKKFLYFS